MFYYVELRFHAAIVGFPLRAVKWPREIARMKLILRGRRFGFSLEEIRQWLLIYGKKGEKDQMQHWLHLADRQLVELEKQRAELDSTIADLQALRTTAAEEIGKL